MGTGEDFEVEMHGAGITEETRTPTSTTSHDEEASPALTGEEAPDGGVKEPTGRKEEIRMASG